MKPSISEIKVSLSLLRFSRIVRLGISPGRPGRIFP
jgi:hypothetical protein